MFIISLTYTVELNQIDAQIEAHIRFLDKYYDSGHFLASGRKVPRTGGVIIARTHDKDTLLHILTEDPFYQQQLAEYEIIEFCPSKASPELSQWLTTI